MSLIALDGKFDSYFPELAEELRRQDPTLMLHMRITAGLALSFGTYLGLGVYRLRLLYVAAALHDAGKVLLPLELRKKEDELDETEWYLMRLHPLLGAGMLAMKDLPDDIIKAVAHHHERWDGTGYPFGLKGTEIPEFARILAVVDAAAAIMEPRPHRNSILDPSEVLSRITAGAGTQFDPELVRAFERFWQARPEEVRHQRQGRRGKR